MVIMSSISHRMDFTEVANCSNTPCKNGGKCFDLTAGFVLCECPYTHGGHFCESRCTLTANSVVVVLYWCCTGVVVVLYWCCTGVVVVL